MVGLNSILKSLDDAIFLIDSDLIFCDCWTSDENVLFAPPETFLGKSILEVFPNKFGKIAAKKIMDVFQSKCSTEAVYYSPFDKSKWYKAKLNIIETDENETKQYLSLIASNCTAEVELSKARSVLENIVFQDWDAIVFADLEGIIQYINPAVNKLYGYEGDELLGQPVSIFNSPKTENPEGIMQTVLTKGIWAGEILQIKKDGTEVETYISIQLIKSSKGEIVGYASHNKNISEKKETANKLKKTIEEKEDLLKELSIFESMTSQNSNAIVFANMEGIIEYVNPAVFRIFGYKENELIGQCVDILDPPGSRQTEILTEWTIQKGLWSGEVTAKKKDGQIIDILLSLQVIKDDNGQPLGTASNNKDITNEKETANKLKETIAEKENLLKEFNIFDNIVSQNWDAVTFAGLEGNIEYVNSAANQLYGYEGDELIGQNVDVFNSHKSHDTGVIVQSIIDTGMWAGEIVQIKKDGTCFDAYLSVQLIKDSKGEPMGYASHSKNISGEKETANKLKKIISERETLLKEIHHRVKNNLQVITSLLSLQSNMINDEKTRSLFQQSQYRINAMATIHETLYQSEEFLTIGYAEYMEVLCHYLIMSMKGHDKNVKLEISAADVKLNIDTAIPLGLLINEIITNALKYGIPGDSKGQIYINLKEAKYPNFVLKIGDDGVGFSDEVNFRKTNSLGLKLIHNLTRQLGGNIRKKKEEKGTHYIVNFQEIK